MAWQDGGGNTYGAGGEIRENSRVIDILLNIYGERMNRDAICTIVDFCDGDLTHSIEAVNKIVNDMNKNVTTHDPSTSVQGSLNTLTSEMAASETGEATVSSTPADISYARASKLVNVQKQPQNNVVKIPKPDYNSEDLQSIVSSHVQGHRIMVLMRGPPGCGKTHLANKLVSAALGPDALNLSSHIFSADDYFLHGQKYVYDKFKIAEAHSWNQNRVIMLLKKGFSPIIVDNTHIQIWEMHPYVINAVKEGYLIKVVQPKTPWATNANQLFRRNIHNVPLQKIKQMMENLSGNQIGPDLLNYFGINYPDSKIPPILRNFPPIEHEPILDQISPNQRVCDNPMLSPSQIPKENNISTTVDSSQRGLENAVTQNVSQVQLAQLEQEWEMGEKWEDKHVLENTAPSEVKDVPKPQRTKYQGRLDSLSLVGEFNDWSEITKFLPPWEDQAIPGPSTQKPQYFSNKSSKHTCMERGDNNTDENKYTIVSATPRDINFFYMPLDDEKIPEKVMISRSTWTDDDDIMAEKKCEFETQHFNSLRKIFRHIPKEDLREIFDFCKGDVDWCFNIILDGAHSQNTKTQEEDDLSDLDDQVDGQCNCLAAYSIVPNSRQETVKEEPENKGDATVQPVQTQPKKSKKDKTLPPTLVELKKKLEENVQIGDSHYSQHCLKIKKLRRGETDTKPDNEVAKEIESMPSSSNVSDDSLPEETETVNVCIGRELVVQLDEMFDRKDVVYPVNIAPIINMPVSTLNELNALWIESLSHQIATQEKYSDILLKQDEEFARKLAEKEAELASAGAEPACPDFKEIMDMDLAISLHQKEADTWRNNVPNDLASRMTREKLFNLFPEISTDTLSELLMAYENNFQLTVEVLLQSTNRASLLEEKNGLNKFIIEKQMERQRELIEEANQQTLSEEQWPVLSKDSTVTMTDVNNFREIAQRHLELRNNYYAKATEYVGRGMTQAATYYSTVAAYHKCQFEQANSKAANSLIHVNARNRSNETLDLHYLYVAEAMETLDLFLDHHIRAMREAGGQRAARLYLITGRGLHSRAGPRIKPAVGRRLRERELQAFMGELNPGLLTVVVRASSKLAEEI